MLTEAWHAVHWYRQKGRLKEAEFQCLFDQPPEGEYVCFDCETTGLDKTKDKILTLSAVKIKGQQILASDVLNLTIQQNVKLTPANIEVHQLRPLDLQQGENEREAIRKFLHFVGARPLVGYYLEFDVAMVNRVVKPWLGIELPNRLIEVSELYYDHRLASVYRQSHMPNIDLSFEKILKLLELPNFGQHTAQNDALMTALIFVKLQSLNVVG